MKNYLLIVSMFVLLASAVPAFSVNKTVLTDADSGRKIEIMKGDLVDLIISENPTTGYRWLASTKITPVIRENSPQEFKADSVLIGAGGKRTFHYLAAAKGKVVLGFVYKRSWEKKSAIKSFQVSIIVR